MYDEEICVCRSSSYTKAEKYLDCIAIVDIPVIYILNFMNTRNAKSIRFTFHSFVFVRAVIPPYAAGMLINTTERLLHQISCHMPDTY